MEFAIILFYSILMMVVIGFQFFILLGAPWGAYPLGGKWPNRLPIQGRLLIFLQILVLFFMLVSVLHSKTIVTIPWPTWGMELTGALHVLSIITHLITKSFKEKKVWLPLVIIQLFLFLFLIDERILV